MDSAQWRNCLEQNWRSQIQTYAKERVDWSSRTRFKWKRREEWHQVDREGIYMESTGILHPGDWWWLKVMMILLKRLYLWTWTYDLQERCLVRVRKFWLKCLGLPGKVREFYFINFVATYRFNHRCKTYM